MAAADADGRVRTVRLTAAGLAERAVLDGRSDELASEILRPLNADQRDRLVAAMSEVERLLTASMVRVTAADPRDPDARRCLDAYAAELARRFPAGFDPHRSALPDEGQLAPPSGLFLVATLHGDPVGCGGLRLHGDAADIKRMWVAPEVRGLGLARRLLAELETRAASLGVRTLRLDTNGALTEAVALYRAVGFREVPPFNDEPYADHWFARTLQ